MVKLAVDLEAEEGNFKPGSWLKTASANAANVDPCDNSDHLLKFAAGDEYILNFRYALPVIRCHYFCRSFGRTEASPRCGSR